MLKARRGIPSLWLTGDMLSNRFPNGTGHAPTSGEGLKGRGARQAALCYGATLGKCMPQKPCPHISQTTFFQIGQSELCLRVV